MRSRPAAVALVGALSCLLALLVAPVGASAGAADRTATIVGNLQSELGCPGDWDPACGESMLTHVSGTSYAGTFTLPAGSYEYKIAINGTWEENYGADGRRDGANIPLVLQHEARLVFSYDDATHLVTVGPADPAPGLQPSDRTLASASLRAPLTRERFYFVMADRFANGSATNDAGGLSGDRSVTGFDPTDKGFYHGGDLVGLINKLDYIQGMGTTAIWLTPSFKNRPVQGTGSDMSAGYHGYWITDFTSIDPHFGTNAQLKEFIDKAHARGMKVFFDIITNHTADVIDYAEGQYSYRSKANFPYRDANGVPFDDRDYIGKPFPPLDPAVSFPYTPFTTAADANVKVPAWLNDSTLYHNRGNSTFAGESSLYGDFFGLDDLFTENQRVVEGMTDIYKTWVNFGIDGFRIDTVKHVNDEFWQEFAPAIQAEADRIGNTDFFSFGEVFDSSPKFMSHYTTEGKLPATLDFGFQQRARDFAAGAKTDQLRTFFADDDYYIDTDSNAYSLPTFLGNHDMGRIGAFIRSDVPDAGAAELLDRDRLTHSLMYLTRGQPVIYYGDEQGFIGDGGDKDARQDMFASRVSTYNDDPMIGTTRLGSRDRFDPKHPVYKHLAQLSRLVSRHPALRDGAQIQRYSSDSAGVFAVSRIDRSDQVEYVVALNNSETPQTVQLQTFSDAIVFDELYPEGLGDATSDLQGRISVTLPALSAGVWKAEARLAPRTTAPALSFETPVAGGTTYDRYPISVAAEGNSFNEVTVAYRPVGAQTWQRLGTDDNAPYRVFHDVSDVAKGTLFEYRAVLRDSSGNLSVANSHATVGDAPPAPVPPDDPVVQPGAVSVPGSLNSELGCASDWEPACPQAQLSLDANDLVWKGTFAIPGGGYAYKVAINGSWEENYGANAVRNGADIGLELPAATTVSFFYDHRSHWIADSINSEIVTAPGSFQTELGCPSDWDPACMRSWLQDVDGDGTYSFRTTRLPEGDYEAKVAHDRSWDENYGAGGVRDGANITFTVAAGQSVTFSYDSSTHVLTISTG